MRELSWSRRFLTVNILKDIFDKCDKRMTETLD